MTSDTISHLYGIPSLVIGVIGIASSFFFGDDWRNIALFASGWICSILLTILCYLSQKDTHKILAEKIKSTEELSAKHASARVKNLEIKKQLTQRNMTLDFFASQQLVQKPIERKVSNTGEDVD